eukprot:GSChrysophyteH1.ASY1.ANO1.939.1 assembled CDS
MRNHIFKEQATTALQICDDALTSLLSTDIDVSLQTSSESQSTSSGDDATAALLASSIVDDSMVVAYSTSLHTLIRAYTLASVNPMLSDDASDTLLEAIDHCAVHLHTILTAATSSSSYWTAIDTAANTSISASGNPRMRLNRHPYVSIHKSFLQLCLNGHPRVYMTSVEWLQKWINVCIRTDHKSQSVDADFKLTTFVVQSILDDVHIRCVSNHDFCSLLSSVRYLGGLASVLPL